MNTAKCANCGEAYDADNRNLCIRHEHKFCLSSPGWRKKAKSLLSLKEQWIADREKDRRKSQET